MNEADLHVVKRVEDDRRLAYTVTAAAELLGISRTLLWREIKRRKLFPTKTLRVLSREELLRYLRDETALVRHRRRIPALKEQAICV